MQAASFARRETNRRRHWLSATLALAAAAVSAGAAAGPREIPPAFGPHINLKPADFAEAKSFHGSDRIVGTYYFYCTCSGQFCFSEFDDEGPCKGN